jgi:FixJ family two-component response regulator
MTAGPIIVVDDHEGLRHAFERLLQASGHEVVSFACGEALLESEERGHAACLILDVRLPGLSGFELRERLVREGCTAPTIFISAHDDPLARARAAREGIPFFLKPVEGAQLLAAVGKAFSQP